MRFTLFTTLERKHPFLAYRAPALAYILLIFVMSSIPGYEFPRLPFYSFDKLVHAFEFGLFGILLYRAFRFPRPFYRPYILTLCVGIPYAILDEVHQYFVPGRNSDPADFIMDVLGLVVLAFTFWVARE